MLTLHEQQTEALLAGIIEVERYVGRAGWDQPARLFALVPTEQLLEVEPSLVDQLSVGVEGGNFRDGRDMGVMHDDGIALDMAAAAGVTTKI